MDAESTEFLEPQDDFKSYTVMVVGGAGIQSTETYLHRHWTNTLPGKTRMKRVRELAGCVYHKSQLFVCGGFNGKEDMNVVERFDEAKREWKDLPNMMYPRRGCAALFYRTKLFVIGGFE